MPRLNDHGLGGGGKSLGVPVYPLNKKKVVKEDLENGTFQSFKGDTTETAPANMSENGSCAIGDDIYFIGTKTNSLFCYKYNVKTRVWTQLANTLNTTLVSWAVAKGTDIYYAHDETFDVYKYDTLSNAHSKVFSSSRHAMLGSEATIDGDYLYIFGGDTATRRKYATRVDLTNFTETTLANLASAYEYRSLVNGNDGYIYIFNADSSSTYYCKYSIADDSYTSIGSTPYAYYNAPIAKIDNYIYLFDTGGNSTIYLYQYNMLNNTYTQIPDSRTISRRRGYANVVDGVIYLMGGYDTNALTTGDSLLIMRAITLSMSCITLAKGIKCYTDGDVVKGNLKKFGSNTIYVEESTFENTNGVVTIPTDGNYALVGANYATIGG